MWHIFVENYQYCFEYTETPLTREEALRVIEYNFVLGNLTHNFYEQKSPYLWQCGSKKVHLIPETHLQKFLENYV